MRQRRCVGGLVAAVLCAPLFYVVPRCSEAYVSAPVCFSSENAAIDEATKDIDTLCDGWLRKTFEDEGTLEVFYADFENKQWIECTLGRKVDLVALLTVNTAGAHKYVIEKIEYAEFNKPSVVLEGASLTSENIERMFGK